MAMRAVKHGPDQRGLPPPLGPAPSKGKKAEVLAFPNVATEDNLNPILKGLRANLPARDLSDLEFACEYRILQAKANPEAAASGNGGGGGKEWRPSWNKNFGGGIALWNLLANAELMTPIGRKFIPNPRYNGNGLSPPQKDPLATHFNNVVDLSEVRAKAVEKTRHSERARGEVHKIVEGPPAPLDVGPAQMKLVSSSAQVSKDTAYVDVLDDVRTKDWGKLDLSAFGWDAANEDMLSGNTDEKLPPSVEKSRYDRMCENLAYFAYNVGTQLSIDGVYKLSPSCTVETLGRDGMWLEFQLKSGYKAVRRMSEDDFFYRLDDNGLPFNGYLWNNEAPIGLMDELTWEVFNFAIVQDWATHEGFETWSNGDLAKLYHWHNHSHWVRGVEIEAVFNGVNDPVSQSELWIWEGEAYEERYRKEYGNICNLRRKHKAHLQSMARYKVFGAPKAPVKLGLPVMREHDDSRYHLYWLRKNILGNYDGLTKQWQEGDDNRLQYWLATRSASQDAQPEDKDVWQLARQKDFIRSTTVKRDAKEAIVLGATKAWNKMVDVLNTPVTKLFKGKSKVVAKIEPTLVINEEEGVKIDAAAEGMAVRMIYLGSLRDDQYDLDWLERLAGRRLDPNKMLPDPVDLAIEAVKRDVPLEDYSESGIYLGKKLQLPRTQEGIILVTHMPNS